MAKKTTKKSSPPPKKPSAKKAATVKPVARKAAPGKSPVKKARPVAKKPAPVKAVASAKPQLKAAPKVVESKPVATILSKPGKNQAGLGVKDLEMFRDLLIAKLRELRGDVSSMEDEALRNSGGTNLSNLPIHMADMGTDNYEQEFTLGLVEKDRKLLREIMVALGKIQDGSYGICEGTGKPISKARLEAQPWTRYSIEYARKLEQRRPV